MFRFLLICLLAVPALGVQTKDGKQCVFPFVYKKVTYTSCTTAGSINGKRWCSTTKNYDTDGKYGYCVDQVPTTAATPEATTQAEVVASTAKAQRCVFPFTYKNKTYKTCITAGNFGIPWCAATSDYPKDGIWIKCPKSAPSVKCVFPFIYRNASQNGCIRGRSVELWCATTRNYDEDKQWILCSEASNSKPSPTKAPAVCTFPFTYNKVSHNYCIKGKLGVAWCSTTSDYDKDGKWKLCDDEKRAPTTATPQICVFPFVYKGVKYSNCTTADNYKLPWCATTSNFDKDGKWKLCYKKSATTPVPTTPAPTTPAPTTPVPTTPVPTTTSPPKPHCVFPFTYKEEKYTECIKRWSGSSWCATTSNYDVDGKWMDCA